uniref:Uncharacterized protein n=1 Tax=Arundo donax TaxID=35708 RepID=A0A0A9G226_ARUDO
MRGSPGSGGPCSCLREHTPRRRRKCRWRLRPRRAAAMWLMDRRRLRRPLIGRFGYSSLFLEVLLQKMMYQIPFTILAVRR